VFDVQAPYPRSTLLKIQTEHQQPHQAAAAAVLQVLLLMLTAHLMVLSNQRQKTQVPS
jgi:hypothetical protein